MTDWKSPVVMGHAFYAATALMWLCVGLFIYDTLRFLRFDVSIIMGRRPRRWPQLPYLFSRVGLWTYLLTNIYFVVAGTEFNCNGVLQAVEMQMGWIAVSSSMLLAFRAVCVYSGRARTVVSLLLTVLTLGMLATWMVGVKDTKAAWVVGGGNPWQEGSCAFTYMSKQYSIKYIVTIVFDMVVMLLTVAGVVRMNGGSRIGAVLVNQGIQYFVLTALINALVTGLTLADLNPVMSLIGAIPSATISVMCSTRLYVKLAEEAAPKPEGVHSSQLSSSLSGSGAEKIARFFKRSSQIPSQLQPSMAMRSTSSSNNGTAVAGLTSLSYIARNESQSRDDKSFAISSHDDLEAQTTRAQPGTVVNIVEERTIVREPMPDHLAGVLYGRTSDTADEGVADHPYSTVKGHFPRLSKS
ncbi:hypothetical protein PaG_00691 [Moesziomyces aphidis]|jgi:hypothetical protein|uniref:Uncharacterized protein n=1 Tax=Moesziomyces aphidis TaxID=84754 RepID=W3VVB4_MOEAP|nr:hypothetical protein PaG_00691 [Moesziomyces aphidis]